jgi:hypothetical protein
LAASDLDTAWRLLALAAGDVLDARAGRHPSGLGLGGRRPPERPPFRTRFGRDGAALTRQAALSLRRLRQLEQLRHLRVGGVPGFQQTQLLTTLQRQACPAWAPRLACVGDPAQVAALVNVARDEYAAAHQAARADRRASFGRAVRRDFAHGGAKFFKWVRQPSVVGPPPVVELDGALAGGPSAELLLLERSWCPLWAQPDRPTADEAAWLAPLADLPAFPAWAPLSDQEVWDGAQHLPLTKAPGPDD